MSAEHIEILDHTFSLYNIPPSIYIDEFMSAGISHGWYLDQHSEGGLNETVLFAICHEDMMSLGLVHYEQGRMILENCWSMDELGMRDVLWVFTKYFLERAKETYEWIDPEAILGNTYLRMKLYEELESSCALLGSTDCDDIIVRSEFLSDEENVDVMMTSAEFRELLPEVFAKAMTMIGSAKEVMNDDGQ